VNHDVSAHRPEPVGSPVLRHLGVALLAVLALVAATLTAAVPARAATGTAHGLKAEYYGSIDHTTFELTGSPTATVLEQSLDVTDLVPTYQQRTGATTYTGVRWTGFLTAPSSGIYRFEIQADNGFRLWVDGQQLLDHWVNDWDNPQTSTAITLAAGQRYAFRLELFQATGGANVHVRWVLPDGTEQQIPVGAITPPDDFEVPDVTAAVTTDGKDVHVGLAGAVAGVDDAFASHLTLLVGGATLPITTVSRGTDGASLELSPSAPIAASVSVRLVYDGAGGLTVTGSSLPSFDVPATNASTYTMQTTSADDVDPSDPLPEYPRPQLVRQRWQNLNGQWEFQAATSAFAVPFGQTLTERVTVPYPTESKLSGLGRHEDHMVYRRTFTVPAGWSVGSGQRLVLNFGAVDQHAEVFVNGTKVADHTGGYDAFSADVTDALAASGPNELVLHVTDTTDRSTPIGKQRANAGGIFYTSSSGIWQTVWMEPVPAASITRLDLTPDIDTSTLAVALHTTSASSAATATVVVRDRTGAEVGRQTGPAAAVIQVPVAHEHLWSPDDPYLYDLTVTLEDGATTDTATSYVGMRKIEVRKNADGVNRVFLNNVQTFLLATLDQGFWPDGVYTAPTDEALAWDIQATKDLGFNTIRKHIKVEPDRWYYHADQIGMMVWQDMPGAGDGVRPDATAQVEIKKQLEDMVQQHRSFTSIIGWIPFNEGWGEWDKNDTGAIADWVKSMDPSRLVDAASGNEPSYGLIWGLGDSGKGDMVDQHTYPGPTVVHPDATRAAMDGEHGGISLAIPGRTWAAGAVNPYGGVDTPEALTAAYVRNNAGLIAPAQSDLSGSVYTQITDVEGEVNGLYTYDRAVLKVDPDTVRAINRKIIEVGSGARTLPPSSTGLAGVAAWSLDEGSGTTSTDVTGNGHTLTLHGGTTWDTSTPGDGGRSLRFDGTGYATAQLPELDTTASYTVQARVRLDSIDGDWGSAASMDALGDDGNSPFYLQYGKNIGGDGIGGYGMSFTGARAVKLADPDYGQWHQLTGVRDAAAGTLTMYVDGVAGSTYQTRSATLSDGTFTLGRAQWDNTRVDYLVGAVDEVKVYDQALTAAQVAASSGTPVVPEASSMSAGGVVTVPSVPGVRYTVTVDGRTVAPAGGKVSLSLGQTAVVTAVAEAGFAFGVATTTTSWTHVYGQRLVAADPVVAGKAQVGQTLTARTPGWTPGTSFTYQWRADGAPVVGGTRATLTVAAGLKGKRLSVTVTGTRAGDTTVVRTSALTAAVVAGVLKAAKPKIKGKAKVGKKLKAKPGAWTAGTTLSYRWFQNGKPVKGKKGAKKKLVLKKKQQGKKITVRVTGTKPGWTTVTKRSKPTKKVKAAKKIATTRVTARRKA